MALNKVMIIGNLGTDPELRFTQGGQAVANFNVATNERWKNKDGEMQERTEWHRIVVWGRQAENCEKYLKKGRQVYVEGRLQTRDWEDKSGNKRYTTEVVAQNIQFLSGGASEGGGRDYPAPSQQQQQRSSAPEAAPEASYDQSFNDDDIPF